MIRVEIGRVMPSNFKFDKSKFKLGMRTFKTGLSIFFVLLLFHFFGWQGTQIASLTAVFSLRESFDKSVHFGMSRIIGNSVGGVLAICFFLIERICGEHFWVTLVFVPLLGMIVIMFNVAIGNQAGIMGASAAYLIITLSIPVGDKLIYALTRVFETFCGVFVAIIVNADVDKFMSLKRLKKK